MKTRISIIAAASIAQKQATYWLSPLELDLKRGHGGDNLEDALEQCQQALVYLQDVWHIAVVTYTAW